MQPKCLMLAVSLIAGVCATGVLAHQDDAASQKKPRGEKLGSVLFKTSCTPEAQKEFERALAMLHSFYFPETVKAFSAIPETDPELCDRLLGHCGQHAAESAGRAVRRRDAEARARAVEKGKAIGAKTSASATGSPRIEGVLQGFRQGRPGHAHQELREGDGGAGQEVSRTTSRRRSSTRSR